MAWLDHLERNIILLVLGVVTTAALIVWAVRRHRRK